jgi:hypothetical protein
MTLRILSFYAVPEKLRLEEQRSRWEWLVPVGEIKVDYDTAVATLAERGRNAAARVVLSRPSSYADDMRCPRSATARFI